MSSADPPERSARITMLLGRGSIKQAKDGIVVTSWRRWTFGHPRRSVVIG
ncbi:MAG: hypothetical protein ACRD2X_10220 [Vicinamibacteraceae bacterium]